MITSKDLHIVYGPPSSGKSRNVEAIKYLLSCDVAFDCGEQWCIKQALEEGRSVLVFSDEVKPKPHKGFRGLFDGLFDGASATSIDAVRRILGPRWLEVGPTNCCPDAEEGMERTLRYPPHEIHLLLIVREDFLNKAKRKYMSDETIKSYQEAAETIKHIIGIVEEHLASGY